MNIVTRQQLEQHFKSPNIPSEIRCNMNFEFQEVQEFLNRHGYEILIREQRSTNSRYNSDGDRTGSTYLSLYTRLVCVPIGTVVPEIMPEKPADYYKDPFCNFSVQHTFEYIMRGQLLKL